MRHFSLRTAGPPRDHRIHRLCHLAAVHCHAGQPGRPRLCRDDTDPGPEPAGHPQGPGPDCPGQDRQRQDRRLRHRPAEPDQPALLRLPGLGAVPDPRTGRPGRQGTAPPGPRRGQHQDPDPVRWCFAGPADRLAGTRCAHHRRYAWAHPAAPGQRHPGTRWPEHPGARRGRPHARHGFFRCHCQHHRQDPIAPPDPAVLGHLPGRHQAVGCRLHA